MTMCAEKGITISTVIVIVAMGYLLFSACEERTKCIAKNAVIALASMAFVYTNAHLQGSSRSLGPSALAAVPLK